MFTPGPMYEIRKEVTAILKNIPLETGDIVFSASNVYGPLFIPFGKLIQRFTNSKYSHATCIYVEDGETYAIDVSDWGTRKLRIIDWFDNWGMKDFCVFRLKNRTPELMMQIKEKIEEFIDRDPSYDFNFNDPDAFYCTEAVKWIFENCGIDLGGAYLVKKIVPWWFYPLICMGNLFTKIFTNSSLPLDIPITVVGNKSKGMMSSELLEEIFVFNNSDNTYGIFV